MFKMVGIWVKIMKNGKFVFGIGYLLCCVSELFLIVMCGELKMVKNVCFVFFG